MILHKYRQTVQRTPLFFLKSSTDILSMGTQKDAGLVAIIINDDGLTAYATIYPSTSDGIPVSMDDMERALKAAEIVHGVQWREVRRALYQCFTEHKVLEGVVIARGTPPRPEVPEHYVLHYNSKRVLVLKHGIEFKIQPHSIPDHCIPIVFAKETIAIKQPTTPGIMGQSVLGQSIFFSSSEVPTLQVGDAVIEENDQLFATQSGALYVRGTTVSVEPRLTLDQAVGYDTGSIVFPGDVVLNGGIQDGFKVHAQGHIGSPVPLDVYEILCGGDLLCDAGLIGRKKSLARVKGQIKVKFIDHCNVEAFGTIFVEDGIIGGTVQTTERITMGDKGKALGCTLVGGDGISLYQLGGPEAAKTIVKIGINFVTERKFIMSRDFLQNLSVQLTSAQARLKKHPDAELAQKVEDLGFKVQKERERMAELLMGLERRDEAKLIVWGTVYPGVRIFIGQLFYDVLEPLHDVRFYLDKKTGTIAWQKNSEKTQHQELPIKDEPAP